MQTRPPALAISAANGAKALKVDELPKITMLTNMKNEKNATIINSVCAPAGSEENKIFTKPILIRPSANTCAHSIMDTIGSCIQCVDAPSNVVLTFNESANDPVMHFC